MKFLLVMLVFLPFIGFAQTSAKFQAHTLAQLDRFKPAIDKKYYDVLRTLISRRNLLRLGTRLDSLNTDIVFIIEGYNFETGRYSIYESYQDTCFSNSCCIEFLDGQRITEANNSGCTFSLDAKDSTSQVNKVDTIFPRKYRYGGGCIITEATAKNFAALRASRKRWNSDRTLLQN